MWAAALVIVGVQLVVRGVIARPWTVAVLAVVALLIWRRLKMRG